LNEVIEYARSNTVFYRQLLAGIPSRCLSALSDVSSIPFTFPKDISANPSGFLAVSQDEVARIVTLRTSGSTGESKRLFFTDDDLELTVDFFHHGMSTLVRPGQRVLVFLPGNTPDSVGDLLVRGLKRMNVEAYAYGAVTDVVSAADAIASSNADCLVGIPTQVLAVACSPQGLAFGKGRVESILLSTDYVPKAIVRTLERTWDCRVFNHFGMTETGLGGGVECEALDGYHLREADLFFEIVDHETGLPLPDGETGEVVFTTLTRRGMPLVRYRTGDVARIMPEPCPCGSLSRRMACVRGRWEGNVRLGTGPVLTLPDIDEALFGLPGLLDYRATIMRKSDGRSALRVDVHAQGGPAATRREVLRALREVDAIREAMDSGRLEEPNIEYSAEGRWVTTGTSKRKLIVVDERTDRPA
jgi:phenylacetate-coenzyme A ligase PaaK-like adenylate-forming protein